MSLQVTEDLIARQTPVAQATIFKFSSRPSAGFQAGQHRLRITAVDKNVRSKNCFFGLDAADLIATKRL